MKENNDKDSLTTKTIDSYIRRNVTLLHLNVTHTSTRLLCASLAGVKTTRCRSTTSRVRPLYPCFRKNKPIEFIALIKGIRACKVILRRPVPTSFDLKTDIISISFHRQSQTNAHLSNKNQQQFAPHLERKTLSKGITMSLNFSTSTCLVPLRISVR